MDLAGRIAIVTGGGAGLGAQVCRRLVEAGVRVGVNFSRSEEAAGDLVSTLGADVAHAVRTDVRDETSVTRMVTEVQERFGGAVELLVNNSGVTTYAATADLEAVRAADWERILAVNLIGPWNCVRAVVPSMRTRGTGAIVNVASDAAFTLDGSSVPYVVSKVGLVALTTMLATALAPDVRVNAVAPGWMDTPRLERYLPSGVVAELRSGAEPVVEVDLVAREVVRLLSSGRTGEITQMSA